MNRLISYDINNDRLRLKFSKVLIKSGLIRIQMSVFVGVLHDTQMKKLLTIIEKFLTPELEEQDKIIILKLGSGSLEEGIWIGEKPIEIDEILNDVDELFF